AARIPGIAGLALLIPEPDLALGIVAREFGVQCFPYQTPPEVLDGYYRAAREERADAVVRITADCPLLDPLVSELVLREFTEGRYDYVNNIDPWTFPDGLDTEVMSFG